MRRIFTVLFALSLAACTTRVVHERPSVVESLDAVNLNTATVAQLEDLPGIGRATAEAVIAHRTENGPFRRVEHLMLIRGVSERRFVELRPLIRVE